MVIDDAVDQFVFSTFKLALNGKLGLHDPAFLIRDRAFLFFIDDLEPRFDLSNEIIGELQAIELFLDLIFEVTHLDEHVGAFYISWDVIAVTVAMIVRYFLLEVMFGRISAPADGTADKSA